MSDASWMGSPTKGSGDDGAGGGAARLLPPRLRHAYTHAMATKYTKRNRLRALTLRAAGMTIAGVARELGVSFVTIHNWLRLHPDFKAEWDEATKSANAALFERARGYAWQHLGELVELPMKKRPAPNNCVIGRVLSLDPEWRAAASPTQSAAEEGDPELVRQLLEADELDD